MDLCKLRCNWRCIDHTFVEEAKELFVKASVLQRERDPLILQYLALARLRLGRYEQAIAEARQAIELGGEVTFNSLVLTVAYNHVGNAEAGIVSYERAEQAWPEELRKAGAVRRRRHQGIFWYDSADEYLALAREADESRHPVEGKTRP